MKSYSITGSFGLVRGCSEVGYLCVLLDQENSGGLDDEDHLLWNSLGVFEACVPELFVVRGEGGTLAGKKWPPNTLHS